MPLVASTGPVLVRCCQHRPVQARYWKLMAYVQGCICFVETICLGWKWCNKFLKVLTVKCLTFCLPLNSRGNIFNIFISLVVSSNTTVCLHSFNYGVICLLTEKYTIEENLWLYSESDIQKTKTPAKTIILLVFKPTKPTFWEAFSNITGCILN